MRVVQMYWRELRPAKTSAMASCESIESNRLSAYGEDFRWRIVWQEEVLGYSVEGAAILHLLVRVRIKIFFQIARFLQTPLCDVRKYR